MIVGARWADLSISKTVNPLAFQHTTISRLYREWSENKRIPVSEGTNPLLMKKVGGKWPDWFKLTEMQQ